jgi:nucleotide-binding universal stress UspA family protein
MRNPENQADMIVMGTRGKTGLSHVLLGSVAERVIRRAEVPVMTVHK